MARVLAAREPLFRAIAGADATPESLADEAKARGHEDASIAAQRLATYWRGDPETKEDYLSRPTGSSDPGTARSAAARR